MTFQSLLFFALCAGMAGDPLRSAPQAGELRRTRFEQVLRLSMVSHQDSILTGGEESPPTEGKVGELEIEEREEVVFLDQLGPVRDGRAMELLRRFERVGSRSTQTLVKPDGPRRLRDGVGESKLEGRAVRFAWDADKQRYSRRFEEQRLSDKSRAQGRLLEGLVARYELESFLPAGEVEAGARWKVKASAIRELSFPGGELEIAIEGDARGGGFGDQLHANMRGEIEAHYVGRREIEGRELAVVRLTAPLRTSFALADDPRLVREYAFEFDLRGELLFDLGAGRPDSLLLEGDARLSLVTTRAGTEFTLLTRQKFEGSLRFDVRIESVER